MVWEQASGRGRVHSFSLHLQQFHQDFPPPHVYGVVELEEGPVLPTAFIGLTAQGTPTDVGTPVRAVFRAIDDRLTVLEFEAFES